MPDSPFANLMPLLQLKQREKEQDQALSLAKLSNEIETYKSQVGALESLKKDKTAFLKDLSEGRNKKLESLQSLGVIFNKIKSEKNKVDFKGDAPEVAKTTFDR